MQDVITRRAVLGLALTGAAGVASAKFNDPLTTPSIASSRLHQSPMTAIVLAGASRVVAGGWRGLIVSTDDEGKTWRQASVPVRSDINALAFPTDRHGWAVGTDGVVLETLDGGLTWAKRFDGRDAAKWMEVKYSPLAERNPDDKALAAAAKETSSYSAQPSRAFLDIAFESEQVGYLVGGYGLVFRTTDAGKGWEPWIDRVENPQGSHIYAISIQGRDVYMAGELGLLLKLDRGRGRFSRLTTPYNGSFFALTGNEGSLLVAGLRGNALRSLDSGKTWHEVQFSGSRPASFSAAATLHDGSIALATLSGQIFLSRDGGGRFDPVPLKAPMRYSGIASTRSGTLLTAGSLGIRAELNK